MAINTYPAVASPIKSIQRGSAAGAGTVTITAIDISKSTVNVFGSASSGTVAASFGLNAPGSGNVRLHGVSVFHINNFGQVQAPTGASLGNTWTIGNSGNNYYWYYDSAVNAGTAPTPNAGSNNLVAAVVQGYLSNSTSLVVSGACRWEVVEYN